MFLFFLVLLFSCSAHNRLPGYLYLRLNANPSTLDPALIVDVSGGTLAAKLFSGLVRIGADCAIVPDIAEKWTVSREGRTYEFTLRDGVRFSNGRTVRASDFKYSFERVLNPKTRSPNTWVFEKILGAEAFASGASPEVKGIEVIDGRTLRIRLERPFAPFLSLMATTAAYVVPREEVERWKEDFSSHPVGTGPFVLKEWLPNRSVRLERREDYFDTPARVEGIVYRIIPEDLTAVTEFEIGNIDILPIPASQYARYRDDPKKRPLISETQGLNTYYVGFNASRLPLANRELRMALFLGLDREKMLNTIYEKRGRLAFGPVPDSLRTWDAPSSPPFDPARAKAIVDRLGLSGLTLNFYVTADQEVVDLVEVMVAYWKKLGVSVVIRQREWSAYKEAVNRGEADLFYLSWWADYPDPENFLFPLFHSSNHGPAGNRTRYTNPAVDALIERASISMNQRERARLYKMAEDIIVSDMPAIFLWHKTEFVIRQPWISGTITYPIYSMDKGTDIALQ